MRAEDKNYEVVESVFLNGMRRAGLSPAVTAVHRWSFSGLSGSVRLRAFQMAAEMTKAARGDEAKEGFGWYGAAAEGVAGVGKHGFGRTNAGALGKEACGLGVHLSPANSPFPRFIIFFLKNKEKKEKKNLFPFIIYIYL